MKRFPVNRRTHLPIRFTHAASPYPSTIGKSTGTRYRTASHAAAVQRIQHRADFGVFLIFQCGDRTAGVEHHHHAVKVLAQPIQQFPFLVPQVEVTLGPLAVAVGIALGRITGHAEHGGITEVLCLHIQILGQHRHGQQVGPPPDAVIIGIRVLLMGLIEDFPDLLGIKIYQRAEKFDLATVCGPLESAGQRSVHLGIYCTAAAAAQQVLPCANAEQTDFCSPLQRQCSIVFQQYRPLGSGLQRHIPMCLAVGHHSLILAQRQYRLIQESCVLSQFHSTRSFVMNMDYIGLLLQSFSCIVCHFVLYFKTTCAYT